MKERRGGLMMYAGVAEIFPDVTKGGLVWSSPGLILENHLESSQADHRLCSPPFSRQLNGAFCSPTIPGHFHPPR